MYFVNAIITRYLSFFCSKNFIHAAQKIQISAIIFLILFFASCNEFTDDLLPDGTDKRAQAQSEPTSFVGKTAADFSVSDTLGNTKNLYNELMNINGAVLYFNMWCSVCYAHMDHMANEVAPQFPGIKFFIIDYVSGTVENSQKAQAQSGIATLNMPLLVANNDLVANYQGSMGIVVVIDKDRQIIMHEYYKDGVRLKQILETIK